MSVKLLCVPNVKAPCTTLSYLVCCFLKNLLQDNDPVTGIVCTPALFICFISVAILAKISYGGHFKMIHLDLAPERDLRLFSRNYFSEIIEVFKFLAFLEQDYFLNVNIIARVFLIFMGHV